MKFREKLRRTENDKMIAGVCSGLADYFDIDVVIVRLIFVIGTISTYPFFLLYILLWIIVPKKEIEFTKPNQKSNKNKKS